MQKLYINIKSRRIELGLTQDELAKKMGYADKSMIAKIEAGIIDLPQSKIEAFAQALKTSPSWLMGWDEEENEKTTLIQDIYDKNRILFDAADDATPEEIRQAAAYLEFLKGKRG